MPDWPHSPVHRLSNLGAYMVTAGTYLKQPFFNRPGRLRLVHDTLLRVAHEYGWHLQAWAVFGNHYHIVAVSDQDSRDLRLMIQRLHSLTAIEANRSDGTPGRKVWFQYWDTHLTFEHSYFARLNYVLQNPVHHGLVRVATQYPWCSATWFEMTANRAFYQTVTNFKIDRVNVKDDFEL